LNPSDEEVTLKVNGEAWPMKLAKGFVEIERTWQAGNTIELELPMPISRVVSHDKVAENEGKVALQRGPLVYCAEWTDNHGHVSNLVLPDNAELEIERRDDLFDGVAVIKGKIRSLHEGAAGKDHELTAIPYYAWAHRGAGEMAVWLAREDSVVRPLPKPTLASMSRASASGDKSALGLNDLWDPKSSTDKSRPYLHWWPNKGTVEWVQYDFPKAEEVSQVGVYWFDDEGRGRCRVPASWKVMYRDGGQWKPVVPKEPLGVAKDSYNWVSFEPVRTAALRLEIQSRDEFSSGILEWRVE
jgi:hypothetical protein